MSFFVIFIPWARADDASEIMQRVMDRDDGTTEISRVRLSTCPVARKNNRIVCTADPRVKRMEMVRKDYGPREKDHKTVTIILEPAGERGIGFLQYDYADKEREADQWLYLSALGKVKRIVSANENEPKTGSFFGSELSYEDMEQRYHEDYTYRTVGRKNVGNVPCVVVESTPVPRRARKSNYSKALEWVDTKRDMVLKSMLFNRQGKQTKLFYFGKITLVDGILVPMQIAVLNLETGRKTVMKYETIVLNREVGDEFLTQRTLTDGAFRERHLQQYRTHLE